MRTRSHLWTNTALLAGLSAAALLVACKSDRDRAVSSEKTTDQPAPPGTSTTVDSVKEAPARYYGKTVNLAGEIDKVYSNQAFRLEGTGWAFDDNITVLTRSPVMMDGVSLMADEEVIVTGTVRPFVVADIERELGWDLDRQIEIELDQRPVLIADSIRKVGETASWSASPGGATAEPVTTMLMIVSSADLGALAGRKVDLGRERVQSVMGKGLWIGPSSMSTIFVVPSGSTEGIQAGDLVRVSGTLQKVPKDAARAWGLPRDMSSTVSEGMLFVENATVEEVTQPATGGTGAAGTGSDKGASGAAGTGGTGGTGGMGGTGGTGGDKGASGAADASVR